MQAQANKKSFKPFGEHKAPFVMKLRFYLPEGVNGSKNAAHAKYICDKAVQPQTEAEVHAQYIGERKGSRGLFGPDGIETLKDIQQQLKNHNGVVWRFILSLREEDAKRMGHATKDDWEKVIRQSIPGVAGGMGIDLANLKWVGAFHNAKGHPHVHLMAWENEPKLLRGALDDKERKNVRRAFMNEFYGAERRQMMFEKTCLRNLMSESIRTELGVKKIRKRGNEVTAETPSVVQGLSSELKGALLQRMNGLREIMPGRGKIALALMPENVKEEARRIAEWMMEQEEYKSVLDDFLDQVQGLTMHHTHDVQKIEDAKTRAYEDLRDRVAQIVLRGAGGSEVKTEGKQTADTVSKAIDSVFVALQSAGKKHREGVISDDELKGKLVKIIGDQAYWLMTLKQKNPHSGHFC